MHKIYVRQMFESRKCENDYAVFSIPGKVKIINRRTKREIPITTQTGRRILVVLRRPYEMSHGFARYTP